MQWRNFIVKFEKIWDRNFFIFFFFSFFIIHGEMIFNKISWWDDITGMFGSVAEYNEPLPHGRWFAFIIINYLLKFIFANGSLPVFNGIIVSTCISMVSLILFKMFDIRKNIYKILLGLILLSIPAVAGNLGYMGGSGINFFGILICIIASYLTCDAIFNSKSLNSKYFIGAFLFACSLGEYQCYFALYISVCYVYLLNYVIEHTITFREFYVYCFRIILNVILGLICYLSFLHLTLCMTEVKLLAYAHTDTYGIVDFQGYIERLGVSYLVFFDPYLISCANMFPFQWDGWYTILIALIMLLFILYIIGISELKRRKTKFQLCILLLLLPLTLNFNIVLYGYQPLHSLHTYQQFLLFLLLLILCRANEDIYSTLTVTWLKKLSLSKLLNTTVICVLSVFVILFVRYDNYCYMLSEFRLSQSISYFNVLVSKITSVNGYKSEYPVVFINEKKKRSSADNFFGEKEKIYPPTNPYGWTFINSYIESSRAFLKYWCGYDPTFLNAKQYEGLDAIKSMPSYPDDGSIKIVNKVIVVKF